MSKKDKLLKRLKSKPSDFTYDELKTLLNYLGFVENNKGKTSGSAVKYINSIYNKCEVYGNYGIGKIEYAALFCIDDDIIALEFNEKGEVIYISDLFLLSKTTCYILSTSISFTA